MDDSGGQRCKAIPYTRGEETLPGLGGGHPRSTHQGAYRHEGYRFVVRKFGKRKSVGEGVTELILDFGPGYRIYIGEYGHKVIILLCGGDKSTQESDIKKAKRYWKDYKQRAEKERGSEWIN
jgi:putative addiction module killer protein